MIKTKYLAIGIVGFIVVAGVLSLNTGNKAGWVDADKVELATTSNETFQDSERRTANKLKTEQNQKFEEYLSLIKAWPKDQMHIINEPYDIPNAIKAITDWRQRVADYVKRLRQGLTLTVSA